MPEIAPIVGEPVAYGMAVAMAALYVFAIYVGRYPLTLAHEGAHALAFMLFLRPIKAITIEDNTDGGTEPVSPDPKWSPANMVITFVGYPGPPLLGLGGAALIADGNAWGVLILTLFLSILALIPAREWGLAFLVPLLVVLGLGWTLIDGTPDVRAAVAVGIAWYLLLGGTIDNLANLGDVPHDANLMRRHTIIVPRFVWTLLWAVIAVLCVIKGGSLLLARS